MDPQCYECCEYWIRKTSEFYLAYNLAKQEGSSDQEANDYANQVWGMGNHSESDKPSLPEKKATFKSQQQYMVSSEWLMANNQLKEEKASKMKYKQSSDGDGESSIMSMMTTENGSQSKSDKFDENDVKMTTVGGGGDKSLCLSEPDSSGDEERTEQRVTNKKENFSVESVGKFTLFGDVEEEKENSSQKLLALVGNLERMKDVWKEKPNTSNYANVSHEDNSKTDDKKRTKMIQYASKPSKSKTPQSNNNSNLESISKLLAAGEGVTEEQAEGSDEDTKPTTDMENNPIVQENNESSSSIQDLFPGQSSYLQEEMFSDQSSILQEEMFNGQPSIFQEDMITDQVQIMFPDQSSSLFTLTYGESNQEEVVADSTFFSSQQIDSMLDDIIVDAKNITTSEIQVN